MHAGDVERGISQDTRKDKQLNAITAEEEDHGEKMMEGNEVGQEENEAALVQAKEEAGLWQEHQNPTPSNCKDGSKEVSSHVTGFRWYP